jgi:HK97 family phage major capsid protein
VSNSDILAAIQESGKAFEEFKAGHNKRLDKFGAQIDGVVERVEELEARGKTPGKTGGVASEHREHTEVFCKWIRDPQNATKKALLNECESDLEHKDVTVGTPSGGGYGVPLEIARDIEAKVTQLNPFRQLVDVRAVSSANFRYLVDIRGETTGWVGETGTRNATSTPTLREIVPTVGMIYAYPKATEESLNDIGFDVRQWLVDDVSDNFAAEEATAIISGNGTNKPTGILNTTPVNVDDTGSPLRAAAVIQFIPSLASPDAILPDALIDLLLKIRERYLMDNARVAWVMNRNSLASVRKLKDTTNQYLWQPGLNGATATSSLLGYPVYTCDAMPSVATNAFPVIFGNWYRGYLFTVINDMRITVDDNITQPGYIKYYIRRRVGGIVKNNDALKALRTT